MGELERTTETLLSEINDRRFKRVDIAMTYAFALRSSVPTEWAAVNNAIVSRWSFSGLEYIKRLAWKRMEAK